MTVVIDAGKRECFYQNGKAGEMIDIEYQVIDGGLGIRDPIAYNFGSKIGMRTACPA